MRRSWHEYFMNMCDLVSSRSTCDRKHVGTVVVRDNRVLCTGYNGAPSGHPHCDDVGHQLEEINGRLSCVRVIHSEINAICQAARLGIALEGATLYCNTLPCYNCMKTIIATGIKNVIYKDDYGNSNKVLELTKITPGFNLIKYENIDKVK